jgi:outer membrane protein TolC
MNQFIAKALSQNPQLKQFDNKIKVARQIPDQVSSLADPMIQFELKSIPTDTFAFDQEPMTQKMVTLSQNLPFPGKLGLKSDAAEKDVQVAEHVLEDLNLNIIREVKQVYYELCFVLAAIDITNQNKALLQQFITITETKYSVGKGIQQDVLKAQVELSKLMNELIALNQRKESEQAKLNTLMNLRPDSPIDIPHGLSQTQFGFTLEELMHTAETHRPALKQLQTLKEKYLLTKNLAEKQYYPDFKVGLRYGLREDGPMQDRPDFVSAFVGINIPLWHKTKQSRKVSEESYKVEVVREAYNNSRNQIFLQIKKLMDQEARGAETLLLIQKGILPQARQSLESAMAGYSVDKLDFLTLLNNQVTLFKWEIKYHRELTDYEKTLAQLERTVGKTLF